MKESIKRQIALDTETTGMNSQGVFYEKHRIIEIGAVEIINRNITGNNFHTYIKPDRLIDLKAFSVHGISNSFLENKPVFSDIVIDFLDYINGAELIIHNATFDIGFIDYELSMLNINVKNILSFNKVIDTLLLSRKLFPGKKNTLDSLCTRYHIKNSDRNFHSALLDSKLLAKVFLAMTSFQESIDFFNDINQKEHLNTTVEKKNHYSLSKIRWATEDEKKLHKSYLQYMLHKNKNLV